MAFAFSGAFLGLMGGFAAKVNSEIARAEAAFLENRGDPRCQRRLKVCCTSVPSVFFAMPKMSVAEQVIAYDPKMMQYEEYMQTFKKQAETRMKYWSWFPF